MQVPSQTFDLGSERVIEIWTELVSGGDTLNIVHIHVNKEHDEIQVEAAYI